MSEIRDEIQELIAFLGKDMITLLKNQMTIQRAKHNRKVTDPVDLLDFLAIEQAFSALRHSGGKSVPDLYAVECFVVSFFEALYTSKAHADLNMALTKLASWTLKRISALKLDLDKAVLISQEYARTISVTPNSSDITTLQSYGLSSKDPDHIASAKQAERNKQCSKAVFVTLDYKSILKYQVSILNYAIGIWCTDPLYAAYHAMN